jgi:hypothetical protein
MIDKVDLKESWHADLYKHKTFQKSEPQDPPRDRGIRGLVAKCKSFWSKTKERFRRNTGA